MLESNKKRCIMHSPPRLFVRYSFITFVNVFFFSFLDTLYSDLPHTVTFLEFLSKKKKSFVKNLAYDTPHLFVSNHLVAEELKKIRRFNLKLYEVVFK